MKKVPILDIHQFQDHDDAEEFHANTLENHILTRHKDIALPHKHNFYVSVLFTKGSGTHEVDFTSYTVAPGALFFLNPGQTHHWELSNDTAGFIFFHSLGFYETHFNHRHITAYPFYFSMHNSPIVQLSGHALIAVEKSFRQVVHEHEKNQPYKKEMLLSLIEMIYIDSARQYTIQHGKDTISENHYMMKFRQFDEQVEKHFRKEKSPAHYASVLNMSAKHLNRVTKAVAGKTTSDVIVDRVLLEAKKELLLQKHSFAEIAYSLGYDDYAYFSRLFKKKTGETPSVFLRRYRKK